MKTFELSDKSILDPATATFIDENFVSAFDKESNVREKLYRRDDGVHFLFCTREVYKGKTVGPTFTHDFFRLLTKEETEQWISEKKRKDELLRLRKEWTKLRFSEEGKRLAALGQMPPYPTR